MRTKRYKDCSILPYDLYCPSVKIDDPEYCCTYCKKICTMKALMKLHLRATQHHAFEIENNDDDEIENDEDESHFNDVDTLPSIEDGACMNRFLEATFDVIYE